MMADLVLVVALGLLIGAVLGGLGGGGAILTVPALVYLVGQSAQEATTSSLVIVGLTALAGTATYVRTGRVRWGVGLAFGLVGIPATWAGSVLSHRVAEHVLLLGFSVLMVLAALAMVGGGPRGGREEADPAGPPTLAEVGPSGPSPARTTRPTDQRAGTATLPVTERHSASGTARVRPPLLATLVVASSAGLLTGFFGVGGGFVIVPALVLALRLPMQQAVGTSLVIVALNSATALGSRAAEVEIELSVVAPFALAAMVATLLGKRVADRLPARLLQVAFAALMVLVAGYTAWESLTAG